MKKIFFILITVTTIYIYGSNNSEKIKITNNEKPEISFAFSWAYGFKNKVNEYKISVEDKCNIITQENFGLNHKQKILIDASSGDLPDIFTFWSYETNLGFLASNDLIINIDEYFNKSDNISRLNFYKSALSATEINGINYAIPHELFFGFFAINKSIFSKYNLKIPETWDDLIKIAPILNKNGIIPFNMGSFRGDPGHLFFSALAYQNKTGYKDTIAMKTTNSFNYPGNRIAAKAITDLIKNDVIPTNTIFDGSFDKQIEQYNRKETAMIFAFTWTLSSFDEEVAKNTIIIPIPKINNNSIDTSTYTVGGASQSICISKAAWNDPGKREHITAMVDWLLSEELFKSRTLQSGSYPARIMNRTISTNPIYTKVNDYIENTKTLGLHEFYFNSLYSFNNFKEANDLLWSGSISDTEYMDLVESGMNYEHN